MVGILKAQAEQLAIAGDLDKARSLYIKICRFAPHNANYWISLAELHYKLEDFLECQGALEFALRLEPRNPDALLLASAVFLEIGQYDKAVQITDFLLSFSHNNHLAALLNKSTALLRLNRYHEALQAVNAALVLDDKKPIAYFNQGSALFGLESYEEAFAAYQHALVLRPDYTVALINQAATLRALQRPAEALKVAAAALALQPESLPAWLNQAAALIDLQRHSEALSVLDQILVKQPSHSKALQNRILVLLHLGLYADALASISTLWQNGQSVIEVIQAAIKVLLEGAQSFYALVWIQQGLAWYPDNPNLLQMHIAVLLARERYPEALEVAEYLLHRVEPSQITAQLTIAAAFNASGRFEKTLYLLKQLPIQAQSDWQFYAKRGEAFSGLNLFSEARADFEKAEQIDSRIFRSSFYDGPFQSRPVDSWCPPVTPELVCINFEFRRLEHGDWEDYESRMSLIRQWTEISLARGDLSPLLPFRSLFLPLPASLQFEIVRREANCLTQAMRRLHATPLSAMKPVSRVGARLKIAYISADFGRHPTAHLMRGLFRCHDHSRFEIYGYSLRSDDGSVYYHQIKSDCDQFVDLSSMDIKTAVRKIQDDEIHILIDLMTYTNFARPEIFVLRPAVVQASWLGFPGSSGSTYLDYLIADPLVLPATQNIYCTEQPVFLPECYQVNDFWQEISNTGSRRRVYGLPDEGFVFCCFNQIQKIEPTIFTVWMRILNRVSKSVLWLYTESEEAKRRLRDAANKHSHGAGERLIFAGYLPKAEHLERHRLADLFLDTRIYNAHTTASDALWAGLPLLTCMGETFPARVAASLLNAVGLPELITHSLEEYEELAVRLATHPDELAALRHKLAEQRLRAPLFDTERFARHLERAYEMMWQRHQQGLPPAPLWVPALPPGAH